MMVPEVDALLKLAQQDSPPTNLAYYTKRLHATGASGIFFLDELGDHHDVVLAAGRGVQAFAAIDWTARDAPVAAALEDLATELQRFDLFRRLRLAASDMELAERSAQALIEAEENDGAARMFDRVLETGLVVTFTRPFLDSSHAGLPRRFRPTGDDLRFIEYIEDLRDDYHAHVEHTERRQLIDGSQLLGASAGRPSYVESWEHLSVENLQRVADVARRQGQLLNAAADEAREALADF